MIKDVKKHRESTQEKAVVILNLYGWRNSTGNKKRRDH